jgi:hypothetical protein
MRAKAKVMTLISAQPDHGGDVDAVQQRARLVRIQHRGFSRLHYMLGATDRMSGIGGDDLAGDQPVEQHADGGEELFHGRLLEAALHRFDVGGDVQRLDVGELAEPVMLAPGEEPVDRMEVGRPRVPVADGGGEELQEALRGGIAGVGDDRRHDDGCGDRGRDLRRLGGRRDGQRTVRIRIGFGHGTRVT